MSPVHIKHICICTYTAKGVHTNGLCAYKLGAIASGPHVSSQWLGANEDDSALHGACAVVVALTSADDSTAPASRCVSV